MKLYEEAAKAALLGSERRPLTLPELPPGLVGLREAYSASPEEAFLAALAALGQCQEAGFAPGISPVTFPAESGPEDRSAWDSPDMPRLLRRILDLRSVPLLAECLRLLEGKGLLFPPWFLPELLERAASREFHPEVLIPVIGRRGRWLAAQNQEWLSALQAGGMDPQESAWTEGSLSERIGYLARLRSADPDRARDLLAGGFDQEPAAARGTLMKALAIGLSAADETFLEAALKDRSREVASEAAALLARLPGSGFSRRLEALLGRCVQAKRAWLIKVQLDVNPPETFTPEMAGLGIRENKKFAGNLGNRAGWLCQLVAFSRPAWWTAAFDQPPEALLEAAGKSEWKDALLMGFRAAAAAHRDLDWIGALLAGGAGQEELLAHLAPEDLEKVMAGRLKLGSADWGGEVMNLVQAFKGGPRTWGAETSDLVLDRVVPGLAVEAYAQDWRLRGALKEIGALIHPSCLRRADVAGLPRMAIQDGFLEARSRIAETVGIRIQLQEEFSP